MASNNMFACVVAGRLVQTNFTVVDSLKLFLEIGEANNVQHLCVFMTGSVALPQDAAATLHFSWGPLFTDWQYIGFLSNSKPSSIFKLSPPPSPINAGGGGGGEIPLSLRVGISIEPLQTALSLHTANQQQKTLSSLKLQTDLAQAIVNHLFNYVSSFSSSSSSIPFSQLEKWYSNFQEKLQRDPSFFIKKKPTND